MHKANKISIVLTNLLLIFSVAGFSQIANESSGSKTEKNKQVLKRLVEEGYNKRQVDVVDELFDSTYVEHTNGIVANGSEVVRQTIIYLTQESPSFKMVIDGMVAEGDKIAMRWIYSGTNKKYNKHVIINGIYICRFDKGKIVEGWQVFDNLTRYKQLGYTLLPPLSEMEK